MNAAWVAAWAAVATAVIYIVLGIMAFVQVGEAKSLRRQQTRPYVIIDFSFRQFLIYFEVKNMGRTPACDVVISFDKPLVSTLEEPAEIHDSPLFTRPIPMLAPGRSIRVLFDSAITRLERTDMPLTYEVTCTYADADKHKYRDPPSVLDLSTYVGSALEPKGVPELVEEVEQVRKELAKWTDGSSGLRVNAVDRDQRDRRFGRVRGHRVFMRQGLVGFLRWQVKELKRRYQWLELGIRRSAKRSP